MNKRHNALLSPSIEKGGCHLEFGTWGFVEAPLLLHILDFV